MRRPRPACAHRYVGFELWQVKSGSIFDNIIVTDDLKAAKALFEETWGKNHEAEEKMFKEISEVGIAWWWWCGAPSGVYVCM